MTAATRIGGEDTRVLTIRPPEGHDVLRFPAGQPQPGGQVAVQRRPAKYAVVRYRRDLVELGGGSPGPWRFDGGSVVALARTAGTSIVVVAGPDDGTCGRLDLLLEEAPDWYRAAVDDFHPDREETPDPLQAAYAHGVLHGSPTGHAYVGATLEIAEEGDPAGHGLTIAVAQHGPQGARHAAAVHLAPELAHIAWRVIRDRLTGGRLRDLARIPDLDPEDLPEYRSATAELPDHEEDSPS